MAIPGERFTIPFDSDDEDDSSHQRSAPPTVGLNFGIGDIIEKNPAEAPTAPVLPPNVNSKSGFPEHKKRTRGPSRFKQRAQAQSQASQTQRQTRQAQLPPPRPNTRTQEEDERRRISAENEQRLQSMSAEEIEEERRELMDKLSPKLIESLLKRATLDDESTQGSFLSEEPAAEREAKKPAKDTQDKGQSIKPSEKPSKPPKSVSFKTSEPYDPNTAAPATYDESLFPLKTSIHFPRPPQQADDLDPSHPNFLKDLHNKYFPDLPADPTKLAWMTPVSDAEDISAYHPTNADLTASALRFDFRGDLLPPRKAREMPAHLGLHHHAEASNAAGYTIPELARLARSSFPSQRCIAIQILGRVLFKLGVGAGAYEVEEIKQGLWRCVEEGKVIETLEEAAAGKSSGHLSVKAYATDALWLWQKGGGQRWQAQ